MSATHPAKPQPTRQKTAAAAAHGASPLLDQIFDDIKGRIEQMSLEIGERLPSVRAMAASRGISNETVLRAYDKLTAAGYLQARRGSGFYVAQGARQVGKAAALEAWSRPSTTYWERLVQADRFPGGSATGSLPADWMDAKSVSAALQVLAAHPRNELFGYAGSQGGLPLREAISARLGAAGIEAGPERIVTTAGASDALHLVVWSFLAPGKTVVVEDPAPFIHIQRLLASGLNLLHVRRQEDGPDLEQLAELCEKHRPSAIFCSSILQNPTSTSLSMRKAHQMLKLAEQYDMWIVDDDTYGDLLPRSRLGAVARLAALDQLERVIHIGSFSKTLGPGVRSGFVAASSERLERILLMRSVSSIQAPALTDQLVHHLLVQGDYERHCERLHKQLAQAGKALLDKVRARGWEALDTGSGMYLWVSLGQGVKARAVWSTLFAQGELIANAEAFSYRAEMASFVRLNVARTDDRMLDLIAQAIEASSKAA
ncbi:PLP-dependent aminotransferase family protein [Paracidovorax wautersii]|uniref:DNA-binding transcriptional regulator, MocR family, contains an aminotransferase domain n=1 Tax=Paracidovorax wautersii TaxID=1177982 RepID=A0A1I2D962_9BURK|nr:PLP-dependent aminotransferase family protein [Paracidovorax wautersii]SFE76653.1 DNA-binding transcriptional regulator, MocR family, contains an aminotransferase domain [Paracidovorax wautersii]